MTDEHTISWIFLATALATDTKPSDIMGISSVADGINHAMPTQRELRIAILWLTKKNLIIKKGKNYELTTQGKIEYKDASKNADKLPAILKNLELKFNSYDNNP